MRKELSTRLCTRWRKEKKKKFFGLEKFLTPTFSPNLFRYLSIFFFCFFFNFWYCKTKRKFKRKKKNTFSWYSDLSLVILIHWRIIFMRILYIRAWKGGVRIKWIPFEGCNISFGLINSRIYLRWYDRRYKIYRHQCFRILLQDFFFTAFTG